jgi:predicted metal-dependent HD superfamily phosphohydrolase
MTISELTSLIATPLILPTPMLEELLKLYQTPKRFYHTIDHIIEVFKEYKILSRQGYWQHPKEVYLAILYHDAIYEYGAKDNELQSALIAKKSISQWLDTHENIDLEYVAHLIELTAFHGSLNSKHLTQEQALFLDCDMAILASSWEKFEVYQKQIQQEYTQVYPLLMYRIGRQKFFKKLLNAERIFISDIFHQSHDQQARTNLTQATKVIKIFIP